MTRKPMAVLVMAGALVFALAGCGEQPSTDRTKQEADGFKDASNVVVWRNADDVPNLATFCADNLAWAATLSTDGAKTPTVLRVPEHDTRCAN